MSLGGVPAGSISISPLGSAPIAQVSFIIRPSISIIMRFFQSSAPFNSSVLEEFQRDLNSQANVRDYLISFSTNLAITTPQSIKLQASALAQLTGATNQLTRNALVRLL
jgi:hypothetical protein